MRKFTALLLTLTIMNAAAFAMPAFNKESNKEAAGKAEAVLAQRKAQNDAQSAQQQAQQKALRATALQGYFVPGFLRITEFQAKDFKAVFFIDRVQSNGTGDIAFGIIADQDLLKTMKVSIDTEFIESVNGEPDTPINLNLKVKIVNPTTYQEEETIIKKFTQVTLKDLHDGKFTETPKMELVDKVIPTKYIIDIYKEHKPDCKDPYHCDCPQKYRKVLVNMEPVEVKDHTSDCVDRYHCDCPSHIEYK